MPFQLAPGEVVTTELGSVNNVITLCGPDAHCKLVMRMPVLPAGYGQEGYGGGGVQQGGYDAGAGQKRTYDAAQGGYQQVLHLGPAAFNPLHPPLSPWRPVTDSQSLLQSQPLDESTMELVFNSVDDIGSGAAK